MTEQELTVALQRFLSGRAGQHEMIEIICALLAERDVLKVKIEFYEKEARCFTCDALLAECHCDDY